MADKYYRRLLVVGLLVLAAYFFILKDIRLYFSHYYEYLSRSVILTEMLRSFDMSGFVDYYLTSYADKLAIMRAIPFFLLFGYSEFIYFYSNAILNTALLIILYFYLRRILSPGRSFYFILLVASSYFFIELMATFYLDLSYFFFAAYLFISLYLDYSKKKPSIVEMSVIIFFMFFTKNTSYMLIPFLVLFLVWPYRKRLREWARILISAAAGFLIYFGAALFFLPDRLLEDIKYGTGAFIQEPGTFTGLLTSLADYFLSRGISFDLSFLSLFPWLALSIALYILVAYNMAGRKNTFFVYLFFISELFLFFLFNIQGHDFSKRHAVVFYPIYLYFFFDFLYKYKKYYIAVIAILLLANSARLIYFHDYQYMPNYADPLSELPGGSAVYIQDEKYYTFFETLTDTAGFPVLKQVDSRFNFTVVKDPEDADYIICRNCTPSEGFSRDSSDGRFYYYEG